MLHLKSQKVKVFGPPTEKNRAKPEKQKGKKEGGQGEGIFALLRLRIERFRFSLIKRNTKQKNFLFLLKEKIAREKIKKCRENFSVLVCRSEAEASGNAPHSRSGFSLKKVRISFRVRSQIVCWMLSASALRASAGRFASIFHGISAITKTSRSRKIRFAQACLRFRKSETANLFSRPTGELQSDNLSAEGGLPKSDIRKIIFQNYAQILSLYQKINR
jgi:hypothetical protein